MAKEADDAHFGVRFDGSAFLEDDFVEDGVGLARGAAADYDVDVYVQHGQGFLDVGGGREQVLAGDREDFGDFAV